MLRRPHALVALLLALTLMSGCATLTPLFGTGAPAVASQSASMGVVVGLDGKPAGNVLVRGYLVSNNSGSLVSNNSGSLVSNNSASYRAQATQLETRTAPDGSFSLQAPADATVNVEAVLSDDVKAIQLNVSSAAHGLKLALAYTGSVNGRVTAPGQPSITNFQGADVYVPGTSYLAKADREGHFTLSNVAAGTFTLVAEKAGVGTAALSGVTVTPRQTTTVSDLGLTLSLPVITQVVPDNAAPGATVTLSGEHFGTSSGAPLAVQFQNAQATEVERVDDRTLKVVVPPGASSGNLLVTVGGITSKPALFKVIASLSVTPGNLFLLNGESRAFVVTAQDTQGQTISAPTVTWNTVGTAIRLSEGTVTAQAVGEATLQVASGATVVRRKVHVLARHPEVTTLAGGTQGFAEGTGPDAQFWAPYDLLLDGDDSLLIVDLGNNRLRRLALDTREVTTYAGEGTEAHRDGSLLTAQFRSPTRMARDPVTNDLYVTEYYLDDIRKIAPNGDVTTLCGGTTGYQDGALSAAKFSSPSGIAIAADRTIYVADTLNHVIRKIAGGVVTTLAGDGTAGQADGKGTAARFNEPEALALDAAGNLYVAETGNHAIRKVTPDGTVTTLAGQKGQSGHFDGTGSEARFDAPHGLAFDRSGRLFVADCNNGRIRMVEADGTVTTVAGSSFWGTVDGPGPSAQFTWPSGIAVDAAGAIYVSDRDQDVIRKITP